jgi:glyoxylase-like metal-dependent hydrolase (beta-lactamase superfamily II)
MQLIFEQIRAGGDRNFGYLLADRDVSRGVLIDPSYSPEQFVERAQAQHITITHIVNTHGHPDHTNGNEKAVALTGAAIAAHPELHPDTALGDDGQFAVGAWNLHVLHVPGHASDHITLYEPVHQILITGDLLFVGKVGGTRTDGDAATEWDSLQKVLHAVPDTASVWPGHDYGVRPSSTIAMERASNPFLRCRDLDAFLRLKAEWPVVKTRLGLK